MKLHLANSDVDLCAASHRAAIGDVFECANGLGLMLAVHMRTRRPDYGAEDAAHFIRDVLPRAPRVPVQIAHLAGWGGYDEATDAAFGAFVEALESHPSALSHVFFDVAAAPLGYPPPPLPNSQGPVDPWPALKFEAMAARLRAVGMQHLVFGTDWPVVGPRDYLADFERNVPLDADELEALRTHVAPWMEPSP